MYNQNLQDVNSLAQSHEPVPQNIFAQPPAKRYMTVKAHGTKAAIAFSSDSTRTGWETARIEAAIKRNDGTKMFDWDNKISIQLTKTELPIVIGVLLGYKKECAFKNHGDINKWFQIENQGDKFYIKLGEAKNKKMITCPVSFVDSHLMGLLGLSQHTKNFDGINSDTALTAIKTLSTHLSRIG